jgi:hypothetical protein
MRRRQRGREETTWRDREIKRGWRVAYIGD